VNSARGRLNRFFHLSALLADRGELATLFGGGKIIMGSVTIPLRLDWKPRVGGEDGTKDLPVCASCRSKVKL